MFFEQIATITRDHARTHLREYFDAVNTLHTDRVPMVLPRTFEVSSIVGGMAGVKRDTLPAYAVDTYTKTAAVDVEDLNTYLYGGHFMGLVGGENQKGVERLVKRHGASVEMFIREHKLMPHDDIYPFLIVEFIFNRVEFFGAAMLEKEGRDFWIDGFRIDCSWRVSEVASGQHGS